MTSAKTTLESIVTRFRREILRAEGRGPGSAAPTPELEVRFQNVDHANFAAIYAALAAKASPQQESPGGEGRIGPPSLTQVVSAIMDVRAARGEAAHRHLRPMRIREIYFAGGKKKETKFVHKEPLVLPIRVAGAGLAYIVALSAEREDGLGFSSDEGAIIRVKARVGFPLTLVGASELRPRLEWRVDMTVTRQIAGSDAASLPAIVGQMFRTSPLMTPANFLAVLGLDDESPTLEARRQLFRYEVEAEFVGPPDGLDMIRPADVTAAADAILRLANPEYVREAALQAEVYRIAQYIVKAPGYLRRFQSEFGLKRLLPQALAITRAAYREIYPPKGMYLTDKADGKRAVAVVHDGRGVIVSDVLYEFAAQPRGGGEKSAPGPSPAGDTIADGELIVRAGGALEFYCFDVLAVAGEDVSRDGFEKRVGRLAEAAEILRAAGLPAAAKPYAHIATEGARELERVIGGVYKAKRPYETDGLIFVEPGKPYDETANYKWKSARDNTIDFLARRAPPAVLGTPPYVDRPGHKVHFLFVGISPDLYAALGLQFCRGYEALFGTARDPARRAAQADADAGAGGAGYFPVQFAPSDAPLAYVYQHPDASPLGDIDGKIVEGRCAGPCRAAGGGASLVEWEMVRVREDRRRELLSKRYFGNDFYAAEVIWLNYVDPFPLEQLWEGPALDYFMRPKAGAYRAQTAVISYVKTQRILSLKHAGWVVDIGAGKGQDLGRYLEAEVQHLVAVDQDRAALSELVRRKYSFAKRGRDARGARGARGEHADADADGAPPRARGRAGATTIHILVADASEPYAATLDKLEHLGLRRVSADAVVCNLAVHYFLGSVEGMRNFVALARGAVKVGKQVILTLLLGDAVHDLFMAGKIPAGGSWDVREHDVVKYSLKRLYTSETLEAAGQRIGVLLPFSDGQYYEEFMVNTNALTAEFAARGFSVLAKTNVAAVIPEFEARNRPVADLLTPGDRQYLGLYGELVFQRDK